LTNLSGSLALPGTAVGRRGFMRFPRAVVYGVMGGFMLFAVYMAIVAGASGSFGHFLDQARTDWYFIAPLMAGFGIQVGLLAELRRRKKLQALAAGVGVGGAGASTVGMIACCAHHIADLAPFLGASAAATFLTAWKVPLIVVGLGINAAGIALGLRNLRRIPSP
jgi:hypothetical protein